MKPNEDRNQRNLDNLDYEISPLELIQDVGVLVVEGRLPEFSFNGRREGRHCWPVSPDSEKDCCQFNREKNSSMCNFVKSARKRMENIWNGTIPLFIEVLVCLDNLFPHNGKEKDPSEIYLDFLPDSRTQGTLLLERWQLKLNEKSCGSSEHQYVSINMLLQAVRSFLHFSQLSAWLIRTGGRVPSRLIYRIVKGEGVHPLEFTTPPETHVFPQALISKTEFVETTVHSLPRLNLETLISMSPYRKFNLFIERQIWMCSHEKTVKRRDTVVENSNLFDSEETPFKEKRSGFKVNEYQNDIQSDAIFVPDPIARPKFRLEKERTGNISSALRKRLSFEGNQDVTQELPGLQRYENRYRKSGSKCRRIFSFDETSNTDNGRKEIGEAIEGTNQPNYENFQQNDASSSCKQNDDVFVAKPNEQSSLSSRNILNSRNSSCNCLSQSHLGFCNCSSVADSSSQKIFHIGTEEISENLRAKDENAEVFSSGKISSNLSNGNNCALSKSPFSNDGKANVVRPLNGTQAKNDIEDSVVGQLQSQVNCLTFAEQIKQSDADTKGSDFKGIGEKELISTPESHEKIQLGRCFSSANFSSSTREKVHRSESYTGPVSRAAQLSLGACTVPVFHSKTGLPVTSSPAPLRKPEKGRSSVECQGENGTLLSPSVEIKKSRKVSAEYGSVSSSRLLSRSAPASTRLLGNFEESVLKGRIPVFGTVEGFTAEIAASGLFCPKHITLPIKCQFFRTSDDDAPSPYMGHISLRNAKGKKGYHIPRKGTIQLTLFNPNKTVLKVFVVLYDFTDMPCDSHTFLRQKIVSVKRYSDEKEELQSLHYLVHLRFASTKHNRIYLHTDIRVIFPQQTPDTAATKLKVLTYGPLEPKYTPRDR